MSLIMSQEGQGNPPEQYLKTSPAVLARKPPTPNRNRWLTMVSTAATLVETMMLPASDHFIAAMKQQVGENQYNSLKDMLTCWGDHQGVSLYMLILLHSMTTSPGGKSSGSLLGFESLIGHIGSPLQAILIICP